MCTRYIIGWNSFLYIYELAFKLLCLYSVLCIVQVVQRALKNEEGPGQQTQTAPQPVNQRKLQVITDTLQQQPRRKVSYLIYISALRSRVVRPVVVFLTLWFTAICIHCCYFALFV